MANKTNAGQANRIKWPEILKFMSRAHKVGGSFPVPAPKLLTFGHYFLRIP